MPGGGTGGRSPDVSVCHSVTKLDGWLRERNLDIGKFSLSLAVLMWCGVTAMYRT